MLLCIFIFLLIFMSTRINNLSIKKPVNSPNDNFFIWKDGDKAFILLKSTISFQKGSFSAFSNHADSMMTFQLNPFQYDSLKSNLFLK